MEKNINEIQVGWTPYDETGDELGKVAQLGANSFLWRKGLSSPQTYTSRRRASTRSMRGTPLLPSWS